MVACGGATGALAPFEVDAVSIGDQRLTVLVADDPAERRQGLRGVEELPTGIDGMLFVFFSPSEARFTMADTLMPLDIWWFDGDGVLVGSTRMVPCTERPCATYPSPEAILFALETPAGSVTLSEGATLSTVGSGG